MGPLKLLPIWLIRLVVNTAAYAAGALGLSIPALGTASLPFFFALAALERQRPCTSDTVAQAWSLTRSARASSRPWACWALTRPLRPSRPLPAFLFSYSSVRLAPPHPSIAPVECAGAFASSRRSIGLRVRFGGGGEQERFTRASRWRTARPG